LTYATSYSYDALDDLVSVTQGDVARSFGYDALERLTSATNPESGTTTYVYDSNGNLVSKTEARGITTAYDGVCVRCARAVGGGVCDGGWTGTLSHLLFDLGSFGIDAFGDG
jgi:YD repeat-containing protein